MNTDALYARIEAGDLEPSLSNVAPLQKEARTLDLGDHVRLRGKFFSTLTRGGRDPWPIGYTGTIQRGEGFIFDVALHALPVTLYFVVGLDLVRVERRALAGLPAEKPLVARGGFPACGHCGSGELLFVQVVEEIREILGFDDERALRAEKAGRLVENASERPRVVCLSCDREWTDLVVSFS